MIVKSFICPASLSSIANDTSVLNLFGLIDCDAFDTATAKFPIATPSISNLPLIDAGSCIAVSKSALTIKFCVFVSAIISCFFFSIVAASPVLFATVYSIFPPPTGFLKISPSLQSFSAILFPLPLLQSVPEKAKSTFMSLGRNNSTPLILCEIACNNNTVLNTLCSSGVNLSLCKRL